MTTSNINKFMRTNLSLKPWVLAKNTSEIVNTCVQKLYKQLPTNFCSDALFGDKTAGSRSENKSPLRLLKSQERVRQPALIISPIKSKSRISHLASNRLLNAVLNSSRKSSAPSSLMTDKKLLRSPNYKIYSPRRYASSASSSTASLFRRLDDSRRSGLVINPATKLKILRTLSSQNGSVSNYGLNSTVARFLVPIRNQQMENLGSLPNAAEVSEIIQRDLMPVDRKVKDLITLNNINLVKPVEAHKKPDPMDGWHHPPPPELFMARFNERNTANLELVEQHRRLRDATKMKQFENLRLMDIKSTIKAVGISKKLPNYHQLTEDYTNHVSETSMQRGLQQVRPSLQRHLTRRYYPRRSVPRIAFKDAVSATASDISIETEATKKSKAVAAHATVATKPVEKTSMKQRVSKAAPMPSGKPPVVAKPIAAKTVAAKPVVSKPLVAKVSKPLVAKLSKPLVMVRPTSITGHGSNVHIHQVRTSVSPQPKSAISQQQTPHTIYKTVAAAIKLDHSKGSTNIKLDHNKGSTNIKLDHNKGSTNIKLDHSKARLNTADTKGLPKPLSAITTKSAPSSKSSIGTKLAIPSLSMKMARGLEALSIDSSPPATPRAPPRNPKASASVILASSNNNNAATIVPSRFNRSIFYNNIRKY